MHNKISLKSESCIGVDLNKKGCEIANKKGFNIINKKIEELKTKEKYDTVCFLELIEHIPNQEVLLNNVKKYVNKGGKIILTTPNAFSIRYILEIFLTGKLKGFPLWREAEKGHVLLHSKYTLRQLAQRAGLKLTYIEYTNDESKSNWLFNKICNLVFFFRKEMGHSIVAELELENKN